eukprot:233936-Pyramimonas_sp.AAC.1
MCNTHLGADVALGVGGAALARHQKLLLPSGGKLVAEGVPRGADTPGQHLPPMGRPAQQPGDRSSGVPRGADAPSQVPEMTCPGES